MIAAVSIRDAGELAIWFAGVATALGLIAKLRPVKWIARTVAVEPLGRWFDARVGAVVDARLDARPLTNGVGWATVKAIAEHLGIDVDDSHYYAHDDEEGRVPD